MVEILVICQRPTPPVAQYDMYGDPCYGVTCFIRRAHVFFFFCVFCFCTVSSILYTTYNAIYFCNVVYYWCIGPYHRLTFDIHSGAGILCRCGILIDLTFRLFIFSKNCASVWSGCSDSCPGSISRWRLWTFWRNMGYRRTWFITWTITARTVRYGSTMIVAPTMMLIFDNIWQLLRSAAHR